MHANETIIALQHAKQSVKSSILACIELLINRNEFTKEQVQKAVIKSADKICDGLIKEYRLRYKNESVYDILFETDEIDSKNNLAPAIAAAGKLYKYVISITKSVKSYNIEIARVCMTTV
jgi:hypothetical protein